MSTTYSTSLRFWEGTPGDPAIKNAWGTALNTNFTLIEAAVIGTATVSINGLTSYTLTTANGAADQARPMLQTYTGGLGGACTVTLPNVPKFGYAQNSTTGGYNVILTSGGGTTATIPPDGHLYWFECDGSGNVLLPSIGLSSLNVSGTVTATGAITCAAASSGTQAMIQNQSLGGADLTYSDVTASRAINVTYTNATPRPIFVIATVALAASSSVVVYVGGATIGSTSTTASGIAASEFLSFVVPSGYNYLIAQIAGTATLNKWVEL